jgi:hypothetical protein
MSLSKEKEIMDLLVKAHNLFVELPEKHPMTNQEWCFYLHGLQGLIEHRICKRFLSDYFN